MKQHLLDRFSEPSGAPRKAGAKVPRRLSSKMKDKILLHLFVLCLILDDFRVDCSALQQDLKLTTRKCVREGGGRRRKERREGGREYG